MLPKKSVNFSDIVLWISLLLKALWKVFVYITLYVQYFEAYSTYRNKFKFSKHAKHHTLLCYYYIINTRFLKIFLKLSNHKYDKSFISFDTWWNKLNSIICNIPSRRLESEILISSRSIVALFLSLLGRFWRIWYSLSVFKSGYWAIVLPALLFFSKCAWKSTNYIWNKKEKCLSLNYSDSQIVNSNVIAWIKHKFSWENSINIECLLMLLSIIHLNYQRYDFYSTFSSTFSYFEYCFIWTTIQIHYYWK